MAKMYKRNTEYWLKEQNKLKNYGFKLADDLNQLTLSQYTELGVKMRTDLNTFYRKYYKDGEFEGVTTKITSSQLEQLRNSYRKLSEKYNQTQRVLLGPLKLTKELEQVDLLLHRLNIDVIPQTDLNVTQLKDMLYETYERNYYRSIYMIQNGTNIMGAFNKVSESAIMKVVNSEFLGETFSDRIWTNKNVMISKMKEELIEIVSQNKSRDDAVKSLARRLEVNYSDSKRLIYTEQARLMENVAEDSYKTTGVEQFEYVATLDDRTSDIDKGIDGKVFELKDYQIGVNAPPLHPYCRGTTVPYIEDIQTSRIGRNVETGKSEYMPVEIQTYSDWEEYHGLK